MRAMAKLAKNMGRTCPYCGKSPAYPNIKGYELSTGWYHVPCVRRLAGLQPKAEVPASAVAAVDARRLYAQNILLVVKRQIAAAKPLINVETECYKQQVPKEHWAYIKYLANRAFKRAPYRKVNQKVYMLRA